MLLFDDFYRPLAAWRTFGQAFRDWFEERATDGFSLDERRWHYGMTLLGDPTLVVRDTLRVYLPLALRGN